MKTQHAILFFGLLSVLLTACSTNSTKPLPQTAPPNVSKPIALIWHRDGGIAGFCDVVTISTDGSYVVEDCHIHPRNYTGKLDAEQFEKLKGWISKFKVFKSGDTDGTPIHPDQMFVKIFFNGTGSANPDNNEIQEMSNFAGALTVKNNPISTEEAPIAAIKARELLAKQLNVSVDEIKITNVEAVEWPDACLGVVVPDIMCAQMITPGYRVMLESHGKSYELHTNESGDSIQQLK